MSHERKLREEEAAIARMIGGRNYMTAHEQTLKTLCGEQEESWKSSKRHKKEGGEEKLYYHCEFNGRNNTCYWAPLGQGVRSYGEVYACGMMKE